MNNKKEVTKKTATKGKSTNRIKKVKSVKKNDEIKEKVIREEVKEELKEELKAEKANSTSFNLIEVIIIMVITAVFGVLIGSCVTYFKDNVVEGNSIPEGFDEFFNVYNEIVDSYYNDIDKDKLIEAGIEGMVDYLGDPFSSYLDREESNSLNEELEGEFVGMGATVSMNDAGQIYIVDLFSDSPAVRAGFLIGDVIIGVDGVSVEGKSTQEVSYEIKGPEGTTVDITILRNKEEKVLTLTRGKVIIPSVSYKMIENTQIGYIDISIFASNTPIQFETAMDELLKQGMQSVIIDVRGNSGGYLSTAEKIASMFLKKNSTIYQLDTKGIVENIKTNTNGKYDLPVAILIDGGSASASEILAGSLRDNIDAALVGEKTFGKGTVQKTKTLESGAMIKYTIQEWYTPNGDKVNGVGIKPNYAVSLDENYFNNPIEANDSQLQTAIGILKK